MKNIFIIFSLILIIGNSFAETTVPNYTFGGELTHKYMLLPVSFGVGYSLRNEFVGTYSIFFNKYSSVQGEIWLNPTFGNRIGIYVSPVISFKFMKFSEDMKGRFQIMPFIGPALDNNKTLYIFWL